MKTTSGSSSSGNRSSSPSNGSSCGHSDHSYSGNNNTRASTARDGRISQSKQRKKSTQVRKRHDTHHDVNGNSTESSEDQDMPNGQCAPTLRARAKAAGTLKQKRNVKCSFPPCFNKPVAGESICQECCGILWMQRAGVGDRPRRQTSSSPGDVVTNSPHGPRDNAHNFEQQDIEVHRRQGAIPRNFRHLQPTALSCDVTPLHCSYATRSRHVNASPAAHSARQQRCDEVDDYNVNYAVHLPDQVTEQALQNNQQDSQRRTQVSRQHTSNWRDSHGTHGHDDEALPRDDHHDEGPSSSLLVSVVTTSLCLDYDDE